jgi:hypothetical protein
MQNKLNLPKLEHMTTTLICTHVALAALLLAATYARAAAKKARRQLTPAHS